MPDKEGKKSLKNLLSTFHSLKSRINAGTLALLLSIIYTAVELFLIFLLEVFANKNLVLQEMIEKCEQGIVSQEGLAKVCTDTAQQPFLQEFFAKLTEVVPDLFFHSVVVGMLIFIILSIYDLIDSIKSLGESAQQFEGSLAQIKQNAHLAVSREMTRFQKQHRTEIIGEFLEKWYEELQHALALTLDDKCFTVKSEFQALRSYEIFWNLLAKEQEKKQRHPLTVLIIHSSSLDIWNKYAISEKLLRSHKSLKDMGGKVTRILCAKNEPEQTIPGKNGPPPTKAKDESKNGPLPTKVETAAKKMKGVGIDVFYYNIEMAKVDFEFEWDFLYVKELDIAVIWDSFSSGANIRESTYQIGSRFKGHDLEELWYRIRENADEIKDLGQ